MPVDCRTTYFVQNTAMATKTHMWKQNLMWKIFFVQTFVWATLFTIKKHFFKTYAFPVAATIRIFHAPTVYIHIHVGRYSVWPTSGTFQISTVDKPLFAPLFTNRWGNYREIPSERGIFPGFSSSRYEIRTLTNTSELRKNPKGPNATLETEFRGMPHEQYKVTRRDFHCYMSGVCFVSFVVFMVQLLQLYTLTNSVAKLPILPELRCF